MQYLYFGYSTLDANLIGSLYVAAVRKEISDETDRETGRSKAISTVPIHLSIFSPNGESGKLQYCSL